MSKLLVEDELWARVEPLLPLRSRAVSATPDAKLLDNRAALTGILFFLKTGLPCNDLPREMGCGSGAAVSTFARTAKPTAGRKEPGAYSADARSVWGPKGRSTTRRSRRRGCGRTKTA